MLSVSAYDTIKACTRAFCFFYEAAGFWDKCTIETVESTADPRSTESLFAD